ncbi:Copia protein [Ceratobasidium theobromae]|uniref:Copia protein n=1 Tax=Ceratobasidium theobromae TaxID=1582974 RepID=A0A5N5Q6F9_9AGAM|nr:Copia protein [Ceratobasidium theobromae]
MIHGHSNTRGKLYLWQEAVAYAAMISNNVPHYIRNEWRVPQIQMFGNPIDMTFFQLFGTTCHVLIQKKGHSKIEAKTRKAIFTGIDRNSGGAWRYLAPPDRAIRTSRNVFFPRHLPDPASSDTPQPITRSDSTEEKVNSEEWMQIFAPSEGEMGHDPVHIDEKPITQHENEPDKPKSPVQGESASSHHSASPEPSHEHAHAPQVEKKPHISADRSVPGESSRRTTRSKAGTSYEHVALDERGKSHRILFLRAIADIQKQAQSPVQTTSNLPQDIHDCFTALSSARSLSFQATMDIMQSTMTRRNGKMYSSRNESKSGSYPSIPK